MVLADREIRKVVLIDDSAIDNMIHKSLLQRNKFAEDIEAFDSSTDALAAILKLAKTDVRHASLPDFIFLDIAMPILDGYGFLDEFEKLDKKLKSGCAIVILTSSINPKDKEESLKRDSVTDFIIKPLTDKALSSLSN
ncbi:MAG: response regulator [Flavobacteriales bacterium]|nr:response regulator [Flavobacteriales bacterium]